MKNAIIIIGTEPPCPRCDYLTRMVQDIVEEHQIDVPVRHISYTSNEAQQIASEHGLSPGTAKDVAQKTAVSVDWNSVHSIIEEPSQGSYQASCCGAIAQKWSPELDEALRPCQERAEEAGIMMTPVLVINGKSIHQGSVPDRSQVIKWIKDSFDLSTDTGANQDVVEILGVGCEKCDMLYARVSSIIEQMGLTEKVTLKKRADVGYFVEKGVTMTPGLVINGQVISMGKLPDSKQLTYELAKCLNVTESSL